MLLAQQDDGEMRLSCLPTLSVNDLVNRRGTTLSVARQIVGADVGCGLRSQTPEPSIKDKAKRASHRQILYTGSAAVSLLETSSMAITAARASQ